MSLPDLDAVRVARRHAAAVLASGGAAPADLWPELARQGVQADVIDVVRRVFTHDWGAELLEASRRNIAYGCGAAAVSAALYVISMVLDTGLAAVFAGTFGVGLVWIGRGWFQRWSGRRELKHMVQGVSDPELLGFLTAGIDQVRDHQELIKRELMFARKLKNADRKSLYAGGAMALVFGIVGWNVSDDNMGVAFGALVAGFWAGVLAFRFVAYRAEGLRGVPLVNEEKPAPSTTPASSYAVPRLDFLPQIDDLRMIQGAPMDGTRPVACVGGTDLKNRATGVMIFNIAGIVFLPDVPIEKVEALKAAGDTAWEVIKEHAPFVQIATAIDMGGERPAQQPSFPAWLEKSLAQPQHFVIP